MRCVEMFSEDYWILVVALLLLTGLGYLFAK
jgi:hypothetical protein